MINYQFRDDSLLQQALTHRSVSNQNNERLEYLGDSILGFIIAEFLYKNFSNISEGSLTRLRALLVNKQKLAEIARTIDLANALKLGAGELKSGGWRRDSILADTLEAVIGAVYLDSDIEACRAVILGLYQTHLANLDATAINKDAKSQLQEFLQARGQAIPMYVVINQTGSPHQPQFTVSCKIDVLDNAVVTTGSSKREAEQIAAEKTLAILKKT